MNYTSLVILIICIICIVVAALILFKPYPVDLIKGGGKTKFIYLVRHGETDVNKYKRTAYSKNGHEPLNLNGIKQASKTGDYFRELLAGKSINMYSSTFKRAMQTADIIGDKIKFEGRIVRDKRLREVSSGDLSGLNMTHPLIKEDAAMFYEWQANNKDLIERQLSIDDVMQRHKDKFNIETRKDTIARVKRFFKSTKFNNHNIIVSHGDTIKYILQWMTNSRVAIVGDLTNGTNCHVTCIMICGDGSYHLVTKPNTLHLKK